MSVWHALPSFCEKDTDTREMVGMCSNAAFTVASVADGYMVFDGNPLSHIK